MIDMTPQKEPQCLIPITAGWSTAPFPTGGHGGSGRAMALPRHFSKTAWAKPRTPAPAGSSATTGRAWPAEQNPGIRGARAGCSPKGKLACHPALWKTSRLPVPTVSAQGGGGAVWTPPLPTYQHGEGSEGLATWALPTVLTAVPRLPGLCLQGPPRAGPAGTGPPPQGARPF